MRPLGFEPRTCGLRVRSAAVHGVRSRSLTCGDVVRPVHLVILIPPGSPEIRGWIRGRTWSSAFARLVVETPSGVWAGTLGVVSTKLRLEPELAASVERARQRAAETGELTPAQGSSAPPKLPPEVARVIGSLLRDGTYAEAVARVVALEPDLADQ